MKRIVCLLLAALFACGLLAACGQDSYVPKGFQKISPERCGYHLYVPNGWIPDISTGVTTAYVSERDRSNISFMAFSVDSALISATIAGAETSEEESQPAPETVEETLPESETVDAEEGSESDGAETVPKISSVEEYWDYYSETFAKTFPDMVYEVEGENLLLSNKQAKRYVFTATVSGISYKFMQVVLLDAGTVYVFTYTALPDKYDEHIESVEEILGYLSIDS